MLKNIHSYFTEVKQEVGKIVWPTRAQTVRGAWLIFIFSVLAAAFFFLVDRVFIWIMALALNF